MTTVDEAMKHFEMRAGCEPNTCLVLAMLLLFCRPSVIRLSSSAGGVIGHRRTTTYLGTIFPSK